VKYLNFDMLESVDTGQFNSAHPYPSWLPRGLLTDDGFQALLENMPALELFDGVFGKERRAGQTPHDRYSLEYRPGTPVPAPWKEFIDELCSDRYRLEVARIFGARKIEFRFHWHYTPSGASVSPHCDASREHGSHLFYFNSEDDWDPAWGGQTLLLDDGGRLSYDSAPALEEFDDIVTVDAVGNCSALLKRCDHGWHAVRAIDCPEDRLRRVFIVVVNPDSLFWKVRDRIVGKDIQRF
jgi:hypothetical protein